MRKSLLVSSLLALGFSGIASLPTAAFAQAEPAVKMSRSGICHPRGGSYYNQTKNYTPYPSMEACIKAGGRPPKR